MRNTSTLLKNPKNRGNDKHFRYLMPAAVFVFSILSIAALIWTDRITSWDNEDIDLADSVLRIQTDVASAHFLLEDASNGNLMEKEVKAQSDLLSAATLCEEILNGGKSESGLMLVPLKDPTLRVRAEEILRMLGELTGIIQHQYQGSRAASPLIPDKQFDAVCDRIMDLGASIESAIKKRGAVTRENEQSLFYSILLSWSALMAAAALGLWKRERQRQRAETQLLETNADLCEHRERLLKLVEEHATGLRIANDKLQKEVDERRQAGQALRRSEEQFRTLIETMNEGLTILDDKGILTYVNDKFCQMLGYSREELLGCPITEFIAQEEARRTVIGQLGGDGALGQDRCDVAFRTKDGQDVFTVVSPRAIYDAEANATGYIAVITDITEKITLQSKCVRKAHLTALGELAAGVAHEINNPISGIINYARILREGSNAQSQERNIAERIVKEGRRIGRIVKSLLLFARGGSSEKVPVPLREILADSLAMTGLQLRKDGIEIRSDVPETLPVLVADPREIQQVFINVISNAKYALNTKYPGRHENKVLQIHAEKVGTNGSLGVRIAFQDRGVGIPAAIIHRIREPFFSTKPRGQGTGLGLSISESIISQHGGKLAIESIEGEFTRVVIELPARESNNGQDFDH